MQAGESKFRTGALHFEQSVAGDSKAPVMNRLEMFTQYPSEKNLDQFLELAKQDFGIRARDAFADWSQGIFPDSPEVVAKAQIKPFELQIKDGFYDLFRAAQIPLNPKQVDLITVHAGKLAKAFQGEIRATIRTQLDELVEKLHAEKVEAKTSD